MAEQARKAIAISELPLDELVLYGAELGLDLDPKTPQGELLRRVRERQELLIELDREALLDIVVWARRPVRQSAGKEQLAKEIAGIKRMRMDGLSHRGVVALARLRGVPAAPDQSIADIERAMRRSEHIWDKVQRRRRKIIGSLITRIVDGKNPEHAEYKFLPEDKTVPSLKDQIVEEGVVGGIARRLRGVADDYVKEKLDEIETRLDRKLDEIDKRLSEWRDRELANRLRIIKVTLLASVIVAAISLGYDYIMRRPTPPPQPTTSPSSMVMPQRAVSYEL